MLARARTSGCGSPCRTAAVPDPTVGRPAPTLLTVRGPVDGELGSYYRRWPCRWWPSPTSNAAWPPTCPVNNAVPVASFPYRRGKEDFCLFLGRMSPDKGADLAILAVHAAGLPIVVAGKCNEPAERRFFDQRVAPLLGPDDTWFGEADATAKRDLLSRARCLVFPVRWHEPFGLVMVEAMACGTRWWRCVRGRCPRWSRSA